MNSAIFKYFNSIFIIIFSICLFFIPVLCCTNFDNNLINNPSSINSIYNFVWPIPGYTNISSYFGRRISPTYGASSYHSGIDLPAPEGTKLYAIDDGIIIFCSWGAGGGYTITYQLINYPEIKVSYCHVSPIMYVAKDEKILKGQIIGTVGPLYVYDIINNPYKDSYGNPTNGASTGCHLHFTIKVNNEAVNPLNYFSLEE